MSREIICFCQNGLMSQCKAPSHPESVACHFYEKSAVADRCMFFIESINDHCDCYKAQMFGYHPPGSGLYEEEEEEELLLDLSEFDMDEQPKSCVDCILYTCSYVIHENTQAQPRGGLTHHDLVKIAAKCPDYEDEESMKAKINMIQRGNIP